MLMAICATVCSVFLIGFLYAGDIVGAISAGLLQAALCIHAGWCLTEGRR